MIDPAVRREMQDRVYAAFGVTREEVDAIDNGYAAAREAAHVEFDHFVNDTIPTALARVSGPIVELLGRMGMDVTVESLPIADVSVRFIPAGPGWTLWCLNCDRSIGWTHDVETVSDHAVNHLAQVHPEAKITFEDGGRVGEPAPAPDRAHDLNVRLGEATAEISRLTAEVERLRQRTHEIQHQEAQRVAPIRSIARHHEHCAALAEEAVAGYVADWNSAKGEEFWHHSSKVTRLALTGLVERWDHERRAKDNAYRERNHLVSALSMIAPTAHLALHEGDDDWEDEWRNVVCVHLPTGQCAWHVHDSEVKLFGHLEWEPGDWDGHSTAQKYERLEAWGKSIATIQLRVRSVIGGSGS